MREATPYIDNSSQLLWPSSDTWLRRAQTGVEIQAAGQCLVLAGRFPTNELGPWNERFSSLKAIVPHFSCLSEIWLTEVIPSWTMIRLQVRAAHMVICQQAQDWGCQGPKLAPFGPLVQTHVQHGARGSPFINELM